jgi:hypothetical protein
MANRKRRKKDGAGNTLIKWLVLFWGNGRETTTGRYED